MSLRIFAVTAAVSLAAFSFAAEAAHVHRDQHRHRHRHRHLARTHKQLGPDLAWREGGVWKEDPWLSHNERDWLDSGGHWQQQHDRYWRPKFERAHYVVDRHVFAMLRHHGYRRFEGEPFWYHGHYLVRTFRGRNIDLVEVNPYTDAYIGRIYS